MTLHKSVVNHAYCHYDFRATYFALSSHQAKLNLYTVATQILKIAESKENCIAMLARSSYTLTIIYSASMLFAVQCLVVYLHNYAI